MSEGRVVIIGGGLAGLAAGHALRERGKEYLILEAADRPGGFCRTNVIDGFHFDYTGHLLHLKEGRSRDVIMERAGRGLVEHTRRASIFVEETFVPYPIQAHFPALPEPLARACMEDLKAAAGNDRSGELSFDNWAEASFGRTLAGIFMLPYNRKLYRYPLDEMEISWTSWSVPRPSLEEIERIASGEGTPSFGYNATFHYPEEGGIEMLPRSLAAGQEEAIRCGARVTRVDAAEKTVTLDDGSRIAYGALISTTPLPVLLAMTGGMAPPSKAGAAGRLRYSAVLGMCLGLTGPVNRDDHWIYFPEETLPFYRIGFPTNFSEKVAPEGCGSVYAETAYIPGSPPDTGELLRSVLRTLKATGIIGPSTEVAARVDLTMPVAYVFHDRFRAANLASILSGLREKGIWSVGRYGAWEYSGMQDAVEWGLAAAGGVLP